MTRIQALQLSGAMSDIASKSPDATVRRAARFAAGRLLAWGRDTRSPVRLKDVLNAMAAVQSAQNEAVRGSAS